MDTSLVLCVSEARSLTAMSHAVATITPRAIPGVLEAHLHIAASGRDELRDGSVYLQPPSIHSGEVGTSSEQTRIDDDMSSQAFLKALSAMHDRDPEVESGSASGARVVPFHFPLPFMPGSGIKGTCDKHAYGSAATVLDALARLVGSRLTALSRIDNLHAEQIAAQRVQADMHSKLRAEQAHRSSVAARHDVMARALAACAAIAHGDCDFDGLIARCQEQVQQVLCAGARAELVRVDGAASSDKFCVHLFDAVTARDLVGGASEIVRRSLVEPGDVGTWKYIRRAQDHDAYVAPDALQTRLLHRTVHSNMEASALRGAGYGADTRNQPVMFTQPNSSIFLLRLTTVVSVDSVRDFQLHDGSDPPQLEPSHPPARQQPSDAQPTPAILVVESPGELLPALQDVIQLIAHVIADKYQQVWHAARTAASLDAMHLAESEQCRQLQHELEENKAVALQLHRQIDELTAALHMHLTTPLVSMTTAEGVGGGSSTSRLYNAPGGATITLAQPSSTSLPSPTFVSPLSTGGSATASALLSPGFRFPPSTHAGVTPVLDREAVALRPTSWRAVASPPSHAPLTLQHFSPAPQQRHVDDRTEVHERGASRAGALSVDDGTGLGMPKHPSFHTISTAELTITRFPSPPDDHTKSEPSSEVDPAKDTRGAHAQTSTSPVAVGRSPTSDFAGRTLNQPAEVASQSTNVRSLANAAIAPTPLPLETLDASSRLPGDAQAYTSPLHDIDRPAAADTPPRSNAVAAEEDQQRPAVAVSPNFRLGRAGRGPMSPARGAVTSMRSPMRTAPLSPLVPLPSSPARAAHAGAQQSPSRVPAPRTPQLSSTSSLSMAPSRAIHSPSHWTGRHSPHVSSTSPLLSSPARTTHSPRAGVEPSTPRILPVASGVSVTAGALPSVLEKSPQLGSVLQSGPANAVFATEQQGIALWRGLAGALQSILVQQQPGEPDWDGLVRPVIAHVLRCAWVRVYRASARIDTASGHDAPGIVVRTVHAGTMPVAAPIVTGSDARADAVLNSPVAQAFNRRDGSLVHGAVRVPLDPRDATQGGFGAAVEMQAVCVPILGRSAADDDSVSIEVIAVLELARPIADSPFSPEEIGWIHSVAGILGPLMSVCTDASLAYEQQASIVEELDATAAAVADRDATLTELKAEMARVQAAQDGALRQLAKLEETTQVQQGQLRQAASDRQTATLRTRAIQSERDSALEGRRQAERTSTLFEKAIGAVERGLGILSPGKLDGGGADTRRHAIQGRLLNGFLSALPDIDAAQLFSVADEAVPSTERTAELVASCTMAPQKEPPASFSSMVTAMALEKLRLIGPVRDPPESPSSADDVILVLELPATAPVGTDPASADGIAHARPHVLVLAVRRSQGETTRNDVPPLPSIMLLVAYAGCQANISADTKAVLQMALRLLQHAAGVQALAATLHRVRLAAQAQAGEHETAVAALHQTVDRLQEGKASEEARRAEAELSVGELHRQVAELQAAHRAALEETVIANERVVELHGELASVRAELGATAAAVVDSAQTISVLREEADSLRARVAEAAQTAAASNARYAIELAGVKAAGEEAAITATRQRQGLEERLQSAERLHREAQQLVSHLRSELEISRSRANGLVQQVQVAGTERAALEQRQSALQDAVATLKVALDNAEAALQDARRQIDEQTHRIAELERERGRQDADLAATRSQAFLDGTGRAHLQARADAAEREADSLRAALKALSADFQALSHQHEQLRGRADDFMRVAVDEQMAFEVAATKSRVGSVLSPTALSTITGLRSTSRSAMSRSLSPTRRASMFSLASSSAGLASSGLRATTPATALDTLRMAHLQ